MGVGCDADGEGIGPGAAERTTRRATAATAAAAATTAATTVTTRKASTSTRAPRATPRAIRLLPIQKTPLTISGGSLIDVVPKIYESERHI